MDRIKLQKVHYLPKELIEGILYVSEEFGVAAHLCPCGCQNKVVTPLDPTEWKFIETYGKPTLQPSIGNWQLPCKSHYWITNGIIDWSYQWDERQIEKGRQEEEKIRQAYYNSLSKKPSIFRRFVNWILGK